MNSYRTISDLNLCCLTLSYYMYMLLYCNLTYPYLFLPYLTMPYLALPCHIVLLYRALILVTMLSKVNDCKKLYGCDMCPHRSF